MTVDTNERGALHCTIFQFARTLIDVNEILDWVWTPRAENTVTIFMGEQCLTEEIQDVLGFKGLDADNIDWQTFFDAKTKLIRKAVSGGGVDE